METYRVLAVNLSLLATRKPEPKTVTSGIIMFSCDSRCCAACFTGGTGWLSHSE